MIIKCIKEKFYENGKKDGNLVIGREFIAYSIGYNNNKESVYEIMFIENIPPYEPRYILTHIKTEYFEVIDERIPDKYIIKVEENRVYVTPQEFEDGLFEKYHDSDPEAIKGLKTLTKRIKEFHNWLDEEDKKALEAEKNKDPYAWPFPDDY